MLCGPNIERVVDFFELIRKLNLSSLKIGNEQALNFCIKHKIRSPLGRTKRKTRCPDKGDIWPAGAARAIDSPANKKRSKRGKDKLCFGCGKKPTKCSCKRKA